MNTEISSMQKRLQKLCDIAALHSSSFSEYAEKLEKVGVYLVPIVQLEETKLSGLSYRLDDMVLKGSDLGKSYTPSGLKKRGIRYDRAKDLTVIHRYQQREKLHVLSRLDSDLNICNTPIDKKPCASAPNFDPTSQAIQNHLNALGTTQFEIGLRNQETGRMINREWNYEEVVHQIGWLKYMNAQGNDIYIRPAAQHGLVLVDDLKKEKIQEMEKKGLTPAAIIETSPGNYQVWLKFTTSSLSPTVRKIVARALANEFDGDKNSADSKHYGRLAGFTNRKPQYSNNGKQPYVLLHEFSGKVALTASTYLEELDSNQGVILKEQRTRLEAIKKASFQPNTYDPANEYKRQAKVILARYGESTDFSRLDWMIVKDLMKRSFCTQQEIEDVIKTCSPNIESRKAGHIEDYVKRTVKMAWKAIQIEEFQEKQLSEQQAERVCVSNKEKNSLS